MKKLFFTIKTNPHYFLLALNLLVFCFVLFYKLQLPSGTCTDEHYYVTAAREIITTPDESNILNHPPLGKYLIGLGIRSIGDYPLGWRVMPVVFGILGIIITFLLTKEITQKISCKKSKTKNQLFNFIPLLTIFILSFDFLYFAMSRLAMLDIFALVFTLCIIFFIWKYFQNQHKKYIIFIGIFFGLAMATKWFACLLLPLFLFLAVGSEKTTPPEKQEKNRIKKLLLENKSFIYNLITIFTIAIVIYLIAYLPHIAKHGIKETLLLNKEIFSRMSRINDYKAAKVHPLSAFIWTFAPTATLSCFVKNLPKTGNIFLISNPFILWVFWPTIIYNTIQAFRKKEISRFFVVSTIIMLYIPWIVIDRVKYFFYMLPVMPFLSMLIAWTIHDIFTKVTSNIEGKISISTLSKITRKNKILLLLVICYLLLVILAFVLYYPLLNAIPMTDGYRKAVTFFWPFLIE